MECVFKDKIIKQLIMEQIIYTTYTQLLNDDGGEPFRST